MDIFKNKVVLGLALGNVIFLILAASSCNTSYKYKKLRDNEAELRFDSQEKAERTMRERQTVEESLKQANAGLETERGLRQAAEKSLTQQQMVNDSLKTEIEKLRKLKEKLELEIKEALATGKSVTKTKSQ
jgi:hypothetical protein